jgi:predicted dithiol-disulfide oxidoreductase (DUF899 family)
LKQVDNCSKRRHEMPWAKLGRAYLWSGSDYPNYRRKRRRQTMVVLFAKKTN